MEENCCFVLFFVFCFCFFVFFFLVLFCFVLFLKMIHNGKSFISRLACL